VLKQLASGFRMMAVMTILTGLVYPGVVTAICQAVFPAQANGSLVMVDGQVVGSSLIGQNFAKPEYLHPRPSAAGSGYDPTASAGTNLGPTSAKLINGTTKKDDKGVEVVDFPGIKDRLVHYVDENGLPFSSSVPLDQFRDAHGDLDDVKIIDGFNDPKSPLVFTPAVPVPADAVTTSASGLDPHVSPANGELQAARIAKARHVSIDQVRQVLGRHVEGRDLGFLGEPRVNVLETNLDLDRAIPVK